MAKSSRPIHVNDIYCTIAIKLITAKQFAGRTAEGLTLTLKLPFAI